jgi:hypothetical protein
MRYAIFLAGALLALNAPATAQWSDNFDTYTNGALLDNVGGWFGWDGVPAAAGIADNAFANSAPNSMRCGPGVDAVHPGLGATSGRWTFRAMQYIPTGGLAGGPVYFILNSVYNNGGPYTWTTQLQANNGVITDDLRTHTPQPIVFDQWVPYRVDIDLDADTVAYYYNGALLSQGTYAVSGGPVEIQNIDLFSNGGTCYWDDVCLERNWADNFDGYTSGAPIDNLGGWFGWDGVSAAAGIADNTFANSAPNSMRCSPGVDAVHPGLAISCGKWTMTAMQYIPTGGLAGGPVYFILNSVYNNGGPYTWTTQLQANNGVITDDLRTHTPLPVVFDRWVPYRVDIDFDADTVAYYYNGQLLSQGQYAISGGPVELQNIDLFSNGGTCFWDDIELEPTPLPRADVYGAGCAGTGGLVPAIGATGLPVSGSTGFAVDLAQAAANTNAVLLFSTAPASLSLGSCTVLVTLPAITLAGVSTSASGAASVPLSIPGGVDLGLAAYMQWVVFDPNGAYANVLALSDGLSIQIGK